jgi:hypothetical protein
LHPDKVEGIVGRDDQRNQHNQQPAAPHEYKPHAPPLLLERHAIRSNAGNILAEKITGALILAAVVLALGTAYASALAHHDQAAAAAYSHRSK